MKLSVFVRLFDDNWIKYTRLTAPANPNKTILSSKRDVFSLEPGMHIVFMIS